jgi:hypothetical protein
MGNDHPMDKNHAPKFIGMNADTIIDDYYSIRWRTKLDKHLLFW